MKYDFYMQISLRISFFALAAALVFCAEVRALDGDTAMPANRVEVFQPGANVSAPILIPDPHPFNPPQYCKDSLIGKVVLVAVIDSSGRPRNLHFAEAQANDLDRLALLIADSDRFKPAMRNGEPVAVAQKIEMHLVGCFVELNQNGEKKEQLQLKEAAMQALHPAPEEPHHVIFGEDASVNAMVAHNEWRAYEAGKEATPPKLLKAVDPEYPENAGLSNHQPTVVLSLIVDSNGIPREVQIQEGVASDFNRKAVQAASSWRFTPGERKGRPVPVHITVQMRFRPN